MLQLRLRRQQKTENSYPKDDFRQRTKVTKSTIDLMADLGLLGDMPESNQLSLFDFA